MNCNDEFVTKVLGQAMMKLGLDFEKQKKLRDILYLGLENYDIVAQEKGLMVSDLEEKIAYYIQVKKLDGLSPLTLQESYRTLMKFASVVKKPINIINKNDIRLYLIMIKEGRKDSTVGTITNRIRGFFQWAYDEEIIEKDPCKTIKAPKTPKKEVSYLNSIEMEQLRNACENKRDRAILEIFFATGCRVSEIVALNIDELDFEKNTVRVLGKGSKYRTVSFSDRAKYHIKEYLKTREDSCSALFTSLQGKPKRLQQRGMQGRFTKMGIVAGVNQSVHPHLLRHTMATSASNAGINILTIQKNLGHSSINTTQAFYINYSEDTAQHDYKQRFLG